MSRLSTQTLICPNCERQLTYEFQEDGIMALHCSNRACPIKAVTIYGRVNVE